MFKEESLSEDRGGAWRKWNIKCWLHLPGPMAAGTWLALAPGRLWDRLGPARKEGKVFSGTCYNWRRACEYGQVVRHLVSHTQEKLICQGRRCYLPSLAPGIVQRSNERRWKCMASWNVCAGQSLTSPGLTDTLNSSSHIKPQTSSVSIYILRFASKNKIFSSSRRKVKNK